MNELKFEGSRELIETLVLEYPEEAAAEIIALQAINGTYAKELRELQRENAELKARLVEQPKRKRGTCVWCAQMEIPDSEEPKPDGYIAWGPGGFDKDLWERDSKSFDVFDSPEHAIEYYKPPWRIRPVKIVFLDNE